MVLVISKIFSISTAVGNLYCQKKEFWAIFHQREEKIHKILICNPYSTPHRCLLSSHMSCPWHAFSSDALTTYSSLFLPINHFKNVRKSHLHHQMIQFVLPPPCNPSGEWELANPAIVPRNARRIFHIVTWAALCFSPCFCFRWNCTMPLISTKCFEIWHSLWLQGN